MQTRRKTRYRLGTLFPLLLALMLLLPLAAFAAEGDEESAGLSDLSLYQRASEVTREFGTKLAPGSGSDLDMVSGQGSATINAGNAGGMLGYADVLSDDKGVVGWLMSSYTNASATITYDQLKNIIPDGEKVQKDSEGRITNPFYQYAGYGEALTKTGLITTVRQGDFGDIGRMIASGLMIIAYLLANVAPFIFSMGLFVLDAFNPFKLFGTLLTGISESELGFIAPIANYVSGIYETVQNLTVAVILPLLLILTILGILLWKAPVMKTLGRYWLRVFMLFAGLPLIGATYTGTISQLNDDVKVGANYANYLVFSSYVDFEGWVKYSRLAPAGGAAIQNPQTADEDGNENMTLANRSLVLAINGGPANNKIARDLSQQYGGTSAIDGIFEEGGDRKEAKNQVSSETSASFQRSFLMLLNHMTSGRYTGSQYDGEVAGQIQEIRSRMGKATDEQIVKMFSLSASDNRTWQDKLAFGKDEKSWLKPIDWDDSKGLFTHGTAGVGDSKDAFNFGAYDYHIYNGGSLEGTGVAFSTDSSYTAPTASSKPLKPIGEGPGSVVGGLSPLAMYNFLNTTFSDTGLTVYSPAKTSSDMSRDAYASVSFAGNGISSMTRWLENFVVMISLAIISIAYGIMMVMAAIRTLPRILSGVFGTAMGSIAYTTKLLISVAVLLIQILATVFMYLLSQDIVMTILLNFNELTASAESYFATAATALEFVRSFMVIIVTAALTLFLIKNMKTFREMLEEVTSTSINRLMGGLDKSTGGKGLDIGQTSGGRVGGDGKLTNAAKDADNGGILGNLAKAHDLESRKGAMGEARGLGKRSMLEGAKARLGTAAALSAANSKDALTGVLGMDGKATDREMSQQEAAVRAIGQGDATALGKQATKDYQESMGEGASEGSLTNGTGQALDENGDVIRDENGNALDAQGQPISAAEPLGTNFGKLSTNDEGIVLDKSGNPYLDEAGNALRTNADGKLVDDQGNLAEIGDDGIMRPLAAGAAGVAAAKAAKTLDKNRFDADKFASMQAAQGASHYGINKDGQVVDKKGNVLETANGPASLDREGFLVDGDGNKVAARDFAGAVDAKGFEQVTDPATGQPVLKHRGDEAMRSKANITPDASGDPMALAKQANAANLTATQAAQRVDDLKAAGAPAYVVQQAERYAAQTAQVANATQQAFDTASLTTGSAVSNLTRDHVESAERGAAARTEAFQAERQALTDMKQANAPRAEVQRQQEKVHAAREQMMAAQAQASDVGVAQATGRSVSDVAASREKFERAESQFAGANVALATAEANGAPAAVLAQKQANVDKASRVLASSQAQYRNVQQAPRGAFGEIRQAEAKVENLTQSLSQADQKVNQLAASGAPAKQVAQAEKAARVLSKQRDAAVRNVAALKKPANASPNILPQAVPTASVAAGFAALAQAGVKTYGDYQQSVGAASQAVASSQGELKQAKDRLAAYQSTNRSPAMIQKAEAAVQSASQAVKQNRSQLKNLQDNAHGLLKNQASFQPPIADRPLKEHGGAVLNKMIELHQAQRMVESMDQKASTGAMTKSEQQAHQVLKQRAQTMTADLKQAGISSQTLANSQSLGEGVRHMDQSWNAFVGGTAAAATTEAAASRAPERRSSNRQQPERQQQSQPERQQQQRQQSNRQQPERQPQQQAAPERRQQQQAPSRQASQPERQQQQPVKPQRQASNTQAQPTRQAQQAPQAQPVKPTRQASQAASRPPGNGPTKNKTERQRTTGNTGNRNTDTTSRDTQAPRPEPTRTREPMQGRGNSSNRKPRK